MYFMFGYENYSSDKNMESNKVYYERYSVVLVAKWISI